jgi:tetratricopeptide (TPR) repeat protein
MLSKQPLLSSSSSLDAPFLQRNAEQLDSIELFAKLSEGFTIAFMEVNSDRDRGTVIEYLEHSDNYPDVQWISIVLSDESLQYFGLEVREKLQSVKLLPDRQPVLLISGLERSIGGAGEYPQVLSNINMERDSYPRILPYPIVLLLPSYAITRCARYAPDFWSWKSIEVRLHSELPSQDLSPSTNPIFTDRVAVKPVSQSRFDLLAELLTENPEPTIDRARLLNQLGDAYASIYKNDEAEAFYRSALAIYDNFPNSLDRAKTLDGLAKLYNLQGKFAEALNLWQQALAIQQELNDRRGKAASLSQLSMIYHSLGDLNQALQFSQDSIEIKREIGDRQGEAVSLHVMSMIYQSLGDLNQALQFSQDSIEIKREISDRQGEAASLHVISIIYQSLGDLNQALQFSQDSIKILREIGNRQGEAASFHQLSIIYQALGDLNQALKLSQDSIEIQREIGNRQGEAGSLHVMSMIYQSLGDLNQALQFSQDSIRILREIGYRQGEAASLTMMANIASEQGDATRVKELFLQAAEVFGSIGDYSGLISVLHNLGTNDEPDVIGYLAQSLWLTLHCSTNLESAIILIVAIYQKVPSSYKLESLLGATACYLCQTRSHPELEQLIERSDKMIRHAASQQGIETQVDYDNWKSTNRLDDPDYFVPELLRRLESIVGDGWLFDKSVFEKKAE